MTMIINDIPTECLKYEKGNQEISIEIEFSRQVMDRLIHIKHTDLSNLFMWIQHDKESFKCRVSRFDYEDEINLELVVVKDNKNSYPDPYDRTGCYNKEWFDQWS